MADSLVRDTNLLEKLHSYNYSIVLRAYDTDLENKFGETTDLTDEILASKTQVLAATGGTAQWSNRYGTPDQPGDAFIKSLTMTNTNGLNGGGEGRISPITEMRLDIVETNGANFIASLMAGTAVANLKSKSDEIVLKQQAPFLLSITFQGSDIDTPLASKVKAKTKHIKIQVTKCNFSVKATGVTYELLCTPYSHMALTDTLQATAYNSAYSLTGLKMDEFVSQMKTVFNKREKENNTDSKNNTTQSISYDFKYVGEIANKLFKNATLNAVSGENSDTNLDQLPRSSANDYIPDPDRQETSAPTADTQNQARSQEATAKTESAAAGGTRTINIPKGTSVPQVLERLAMNSTLVGEYFKQNPSDRSSYIPFIRVFPIIETKSTVDKEKNVTEKVIVFNIVGIEMAAPRGMDIKNPDRVAETLAKIKSQTFRVYNYLWTGGNQSILNLDIRYDNLYTQAYNIWHKTVENKNPNADRATNNGESSNASQPSAKPNEKNNSPPPGAGNQNNVTVPIRQGNSGADAAMPKDYLGAADRLRTMLPDIFNSQVEKSIYRANIEIIGDPDYLSEVDAIRTQGHLENLVKEFDEAAGRAFSVTTAGSTEGPTTDAEKSSGAKVENNAAVTAAVGNSETQTITVIGRRIKFTPFEPYYIQVHIGNSKGKQFGGTEFGGYYLPIKFTHNFSENGKFTTLIDAVKAQGLDLKSVESDPPPGTKDVVTPSKTGSETTQPTSASSTGSPAGALQNATKAADATKAALGNAAETGAKNAANVASQVVGAGAAAKDSPGNSPPAQLVTGAGQLGVSVKLPSTVDAPTTAAAAKASADKNLGGSIDKNPGEDVAAPPKNKLFDVIKQTNQLNTEMQKLANTAGDAVSKMGGELNTMMAGMADKAGTALKNAFSGAAGDLKGKATGMLGKAASSLKDPAGGLTKAAGSITDSLNKGVAGIVGPGAAAGGGATASPSGGLSAGVTDVISKGANIGAGLAKSAAEQLSTKIASFQIPGMPLMAGPTKEDLTNKLKSMSKIESPPIDLNTGQLKLPDVKAAADAAAGAATGLADKAAGAIGGAVDKLTSKLPSAEKVSGAVDKLTGAAAGAAAEAEKVLAAPFSAAQIKENSTKLSAAIKDITKDVMGKVPAINPAAALKSAAGELDKAVTGAGLPSLGAAPSLGGAGSVATAAQSKLSTGLKSVTGAITGAVKDGASSLINNAVNSFKGVDTKVIAGAGANALSGVTAAASKGLGGTSLSDAITAKATAAMGPMSGVNNPVSTLADKVKNFKLPEIELPKIDLGGAVGASIAKVEGELAKISLKEVQSASGAGNLSIAEQTAAAEKLAVSSLASANALPNAIPGSVKIVGLNDVIPKFELDQKTGTWLKPIPKLTMPSMPSLSGLPSVSVAGLPSMPSAPSLPSLPKIG